MKLLESRKPITDDGGDEFVGAKFGDYVKFFTWDVDNNIHNIEHTFQGPPGSAFGREIAMTSNGSHLVVSAPQASVGSEFATGTVVGYRRRNFFFVSLLNGLGYKNYYGTSVSISLDETYLAVGAGVFLFGGSVILYKYQNNRYEQVGDTIFAYQTRVALSADRI